jgi:hypothetical protein
VWLGDHGWWAVVVEFQPSSWCRGSYLNVAAMWQWVEKDYLSFDHNSRVEGFARFEDEAQFAPLADGLAGRAADEVRRLRDLFPTVRAAAEVLATKSPRGFWDAFHAGVASGLAGDPGRARELFAEVSATPDQRDWVQEAVALTREYALAVGDTHGFRCRIEEVVRRARELLRFPDRADLVLG